MKVLLYVQKIRGHNGIIDLDVSDDELEILKAVHNEVLSFRNLRNKTNCEQMQKIYDALHSKHEENFGTDWVGKWAYQYP